LKDFEKVHDETESSPHKEETAETKDFW